MRCINPDHKHEPTPFNYELATDAQLQDQWLGAMWFNCQTEDPEEYKRTEEAMLKVEAEQKRREDNVK